MNQPIYLYNTLNRQKDKFQPINPGEVTLYTCGPTVYDFAHIGNLRTYVFEDILRRVLEFNEYKVNHGMNITDVGHLVGDGDEGEDKLEVGAKREGKHPLEIAKQYEERFFDDLKKLNILLPTDKLRATDAIPEQIELINRLLDKGVAYKTESAIYFDTSKLPDYGELSGQNLAEKEVGARGDVVVDSEKKSPQDFALWFFLVGRYERHVLHWPSPWGAGFPGWHVECSAISRKLLGQPFDIHTGGVDHIGTHHTNEIAQSEAAYEAPLANYWLHGEFLLVDGKRMGKSEGNYITLETVVRKGFSPVDFRYLCLMAHYRSKMNFTWEALEAARNTIVRLRQSVNSGAKQQINENQKNNILEALNDDLDTPRALAFLHEYNNSDLWREFDKVLSLNIVRERKIEEEAESLLLERNKAKAAKDFVQADSLRQQLESLGYTVVDSAEGSKLIPR